MSKIGMIPKLDNKNLIKNIYTGVGGCRCIKGTVLSLG